MKKWMLVLLATLPMVGVLGMSTKVDEIEEKMLGVVNSQGSEDLLCRNDYTFDLQYKKPSPSSSYKTKKSKNYIRWNWLTWDSENRFFVSLFGGTSIFQHERIFREIPNSHIFGLKFEPAFGAALGYRFNPIWTFRAKAMTSKAFYATTESKRIQTGEVSINAFSLNAGFDLIKMIAPMNDGKNNFSPYFGLGFIVPNSYIKSPVSANVGLAYVYNVSNRFSLNLDAEMLVLFGVDNKIKKYRDLIPFNLNGSLLLGVSYRF